MNSASRLDRDLMQLGKASPALTVTAASTVLVVVKVLVATRLRLPDALAVLSAANLASVLAGFVLLITPLAVAFVAAYLWIRISLEGNWAGSQLAVGVAGLLTFAAFALSPWFLFAGLGGITLVEVVVNSIRRERNEGSSTDETGRTTPWLGELMFAAGVVTSLVIGSNVFWAPTEIISVTGNLPVVAYDIGEANGWTTLLREDDGVAVLVRSSDITGRRPCSRSDARMQSLLQVLIGPPSGAAVPCT